MKYRYVQRRFLAPLLFLLTLLLVDVGVTSAQVANYRFSQQIDTYKPLTGGNIVAKATGITGVDGLNNINVPVRLPFPFSFNSRVYDTCYISENGFITFSDAAYTGYFPLSNAFPPLYPAIAAMAVDLSGVFVTGATFTKGSAVVTNVASFKGFAAGLPVAGTAIPAGATVLSFDTLAKTITFSAEATLTSATGVVRWPVGRIVTDVTGSGNGRKFIIEYQRLSENGTIVSSSSNFDFQIQLEETTNKIHVVYGDFSVQANGGNKNCQVGLRGDVVTDYNNRTVAAGTPWIATTAGTIQSAFAVRNSLNLPSSGLTFTLEPQSCYFPTSLKYSLVSSTSMTIHWDAPSLGDPVTEYQWEVRTSGGPGSGATGLVSTGTTKSNSANISGLIPGTMHYVYLRTDCGNGSRSNWTPMRSVKVPCDQVFTTPYKEGFTTFTTYPDIIPPACWSIATGLLGSAQTFFSGYPSMDRTWNTQVWTLDIKDKMTFLDMLENNAGEWLISPSIDLGSGNKQIKFDMLMQSVLTNIKLGADDTVALVISTDNGRTWSKNNIVHAWTSMNTPLQDTSFIIKIGNYKDTVRIAFYVSEGVYDNTRQETVKIHDFSVVDIPCFELNLGKDIAGCNDGNRADTLNAGEMQGATYLWDDLSTTHQRIVRKSGTYYVKVVKDGCTRYDTVTVTYNPYPTPVHLGNDTTICGSDTLWLSAGRTVDKVRWYEGGNYLPLLTSDPNHLPVTASGIYRVTVEDPAYCGIVRDTISITVIAAIPQVDLGNDTSICQSAPILLDAGNPGLKTEWNNKIVAPTLQVDTSGRYYVTVTDNDGCQGSDTILVTVLPVPEIDLGNDTTICEGVSLLLDAGGAAQSYLWNDGSSERARTVTEAGQYAVTVTGANNCTTSDTINVDLYDLPLFGSIAAKALGDYKYTFDVRGAQHVESYSWDFGDGSPIQTGTPVEHQYENGGIYTVVLTVSGEGDCDDYVDSTILEIKGLAIDHPYGKSDGIMIYPNPNHGAFLLEYTVGAGPKEVSVYNIYGRSVYTGTLHASGKQFLNLEYLPAGTYYLKMSDEKSTDSLKFMIQ